MKQFYVHICVVITTATLLVMTSCQKQADQAARTLTEEQTNVATGSRLEISDQIRFTQFGLYPEGVAFDKFNDRFLVSSFGKGTIGTVSLSGEYTSFIEDPDLKSTLGLHIDEARKRVVTAVTDGLFGDV